MFCCECSEVLRCLSVTWLLYFPSGGRESPSFVYQQKHCNRINMIHPVQKNGFVDLIFVHEY